MRVCDFWPAKMVILWIFSNRLKINCLFKHKGQIAIWAMAIWIFHGLPLYMLARSAPIKETQEDQHDKEKCENVGQNLHIALCIVYMCVLNMFILCKAYTCRRVKMGEDIKLKYEMRGATCPGKGGRSTVSFHHSFFCVGKNTPHKAVSYTHLTLPTILLV